MGGSGATPALIDVSWSVTDGATGLAADCKSLEGYSIDLVTTTGTLLAFNNDSCEIGTKIVHSKSAAVPAAGIRGSLELLAPNGSVLAQDPVPPSELASADIRRTFQVDDVCKHNRYLSLFWTVDNGVGTAIFSCTASAAYKVALTTTTPPATFTLLGTCDDSYQPNWYGVSEDGVAPGSYAVTASLLDGSGAAVSQTPMQAVSIGACSPGALNGGAGTAFGLR